MKERPILFSAPMVKAILDGQKTMTRRVNSIGEYYISDKKCPYGVVGDRLWVRETWWINENEDTVLYKANVPFPKPWTPAYEFKWRPSIFMPRWASRITLEITGISVERLQDITEEDAEREGVPDEYPIPSVYCPRCAGLGSRSFKTTETGCPNCDTAKKRFRNLWDSINGRKSDKTWKDNPWVWVVEFRRVGDV